MRALVISRQGSPVAGNVQFVKDFADPVPGPGEVKVRTEASAMNHLDLWVGMGLPGIDLTYPCISGSDGVGRVSAVGPGVDADWIDRRVLLNAAIPVEDPVRPGWNPAPADIRMIGEHENGCHGEYFIAPASNIVDVGDTNPVTAAAFGLTHLTAWRMMRTKARLEPGHLVLITGIGGGVALAALNIATYFNCTTVVTSRHQWKLDRARDMGADHCILDSGEDFSRDVRAATNKRGVDICIDSIGRAVHESCIKTLARGGTFVTCGCTSGPNPPTDLARIFWSQLSVLGSTMGDMNEFRQVTALLLSGEIEPVIDSTMLADDGQKAYEKLESGEQFGKIVLDWS